MEQTKRWTKLLAINSFVLLVLLLILEALCWSVYNYLLPIERNQNFFAGYDSEIGWQNTPNADGTFDNGGILESKVTINKFGLRGKPVTIHKPAGVFRVALLGDSFAWGLGVNNEETISAQLNRRLGPEIEVLNFAVSGYGRGQQLLKLKRDVLLFSPDAVIVLAFPGNDLYDNVADDPKKEAYPRPRFALDNNQNLVIHGQPVPKTDQEFSERRLAISAGKLMWLYLHSYTFRVYFHLTNSKNKAVLNIPPYYFPVFQKDNKTKLEHQSKVETAILREMNSLLTKRNIPVLMAIATTMEQLSPAIQTQIKDKFPEMQLDWHQPTQILLEAATKAKIPVIDLYPYLVKHNTTDKQVHHPIDTHWTAYGHEVAAKALQPWIEQKYMESIEKRSLKNISRVMK